MTNQHSHKYKNVSEEIITRIANGEWKEGEKIPSEQELCQLLGVSRVTLRESLKALDILGVIKIVQGDGTYVQKVSPARMVRHLTPLLKVNPVSAAELFRARIVVEGSCCGLAAENRTEEDIQELQDLIEQMRDAFELGNIEMYSVADRKFHTSINRMSGNELLIAISELFEGLVEYYVGIINENPDAINSSMQDHEKIYEMIRDQRSDAAKMFMEEHLRAAYQYLLTTTEEGSVREGNA